MRVRNAFSLLIVLYAFVFASSINAETNQALASKGFAHYEADEYEEAIAVLTELVELEPDNANYHHTLAKSYGRQAEQVNWFKAINYAQKTLEHLEIAVSIEPRNVKYLGDLMDYYNEAPAFLGGDKKKAASIKARIDGLITNNTPYYSGKLDRNNLEGQ
ncbi:MAG: tetratricopeptide repeat protein [Pseudomonadota bacterium]